MCINVSQINGKVAIVTATVFRPVRGKDVEGGRLLAGMEGLLHRDGQRRPFKQLLVLNGGAPEGLPHRDILKGHWGQTDQNPLGIIPNCSYEISLLCLLAVQLA